MPLNELNKTGAIIDKATVRYNKNIKKSSSFVSVYSIIYFVQEEIDRSLELEDKFQKIKEKTWKNNVLAILSELAVQLGQLKCIIYDSTNVEEENRNFNNINDELCDILLQLLYLVNMQKITFNNIAEKYKTFSETDLDKLTILHGQLTECLLEENGYRFKKDRPGFETREDFIEDIIIKMFLIIFNYAQVNGIDIFKEFNLMCIDAENFVDKKTVPVQQITKLAKCV